MASTNGSTSSNRSMTSFTQPSSYSYTNIGVLDVIVFIGLESLGILAILGNISLILVLLRNKYLNRASFILMLSLAIADVLHGIVTTTFFFPPVILKFTPMSEMGIRLYNIVDWTAWAVTLTHMSAICLDRLVAIMLYSRYNQLVTVPRIQKFCIIVWLLFLSVNTVFFSLNLCCLTQPLKEHNFYTFGYLTYDTPQMNIYTLYYTPVEILTICILTVSNPITLVQLYRRHKRKVALRMQGSSKSSVAGGVITSQRSQWQRASTMLLEMSMKMGSRAISTDVRDVATRRANRQQQRILVQISVVALIFYAYMTAYYISYYVTYLQSTATMIFNSFFYSTTHMINPVIYFSLNKEMLEQLIDAIKTYYRILTCRPKPPLPSRSNTHREHTIDRAHPSCATYSETIPFFSSSSVANYKTTTSSNGNFMRERDVEKLVVENDDVFHDKISEGEEEEDEIIEASSAMMESVAVTKDSYLTDDQLNKLQDRERSEFMNDLISALKCESNPSLNVPDEQENPPVFPSSFPSTSFKRVTLKPSISLDIPRGIHGRFMRVSNTVQVISKCPQRGLTAFNSITIDRDESDLKMNGRCESSTSKESANRPSKPIPSSSSNDSSSSTPVSSFSDHSWRRLTGSHTDSMSLIQHEFVDSSDNEEEISYL